MIQNTNYCCWFATEKTTKIRMKCVQIRKTDKSENNSKYVYYLQITPKGKHLHL